MRRVRCCRWSSNWSARLELAEARGCQVVAVLGEAGRAPRQAERLAATGVAEVIHAVDERLAHADAEVFTQWICALAEERRPEAMLFGATAFGRELAPRVAVRLQTGLTAGAPRSTSTPRPALCCKRALRSVATSWLRSSAPRIVLRWRRCGRAYLRALSA